MAPDGALAGTFAVTLDAEGRGFGRVPRHGRRVREVTAGGVGHLSFEGLGQAEIEDLDLAVGCQLDVGGLEVAVDDALLVGFFEGLGDLFRDPRGFIDGNRAAPLSFREIFAADQFQPHSPSLPRIR
jgi:hypothetical protein